MMTAVLVLSAGYSERRCRHHHLPQWFSSFDVFRHRRIAIVSWGVHYLFFLEVCSWGRVSGVWCCPFFQGGWSSFVCICVSRLVFQRSLVLYLWLHFLFYPAWIGYVLRRNCLLKQVIEGKIKGQIEVTRRQGGSRKKLLDVLKDRRGYCELKEEALDRTMWRNRFARGFGPVVWQITDDVWIRKTN